MPPLKSPLISLFDAYIPLALQEDLLVRCIVRGYADSATKCLEGYSEEQAHDLRPIMRRADIHEYMRGLAPRHPDVKIWSELNEGDNYYDVRVSSGRITFTVSCVASPTLVPRDAIYRRNLANLGQGVLAGADFSHLEPPAPSDDQVYALIIHGPVENDSIQRFPRFVEVVFPGPDCKGVAIDRLHLLARFRDHADIRGIPGVEEIGEPEVGLLEREQEETE